MKKLKAKINEQDRYGYTALHYAARNDRIDVLKYLISLGDIEVNLTTNGGASALHRAAIGKGTESLLLLLECNRIDTTLVDDENQNFMHKVAQAKKNALFDTLLTKYGHLNVPDKKGKLPVDYL